MSRFGNTVHGWRYDDDATGDEQGEDMYGLCALDDDDDDGPAPCSDSESPSAINDWKNIDSSIPVICKSLSFARLSSNVVLLIVKSSSDILNELNKSLTFS